MCVFLLQTVEALRGATAWLHLL